MGEWTDSGGTWIHDAQKTGVLEMEHCQTSEIVYCRNKEVERSIDEVVRLLEHTPCGNAEGADLPDVAKSDFKKHHSLRMHQVTLPWCLSNSAKTFRQGSLTPRVAQETTNCPCICQFL